LAGYTVELICDLFGQALTFDSQGGDVVEGLEVLQARFTELMEQARREYGMITTENTEKNPVPSVVIDRLYSLATSIESTTITELWSTPFARPR
jgi:hypothetical protein